MNEGALSLDNYPLINTAMQDSSLTNMEKLKITLHKRSYCDHSVPFRLQHRNLEKKAKIEVHDINQFPHQLGRECDHLSLR